MLKIGEVSKLSGVSVRALHDYERKGLLKPSARTEAGYRLYIHSDLDRLQQILFYKALNFSLEEISKIIQAPNFDRNKTLIKQRELILQQKNSLQSVLDLIDKTIQQIREENIVTPTEKLSVFRNFDAKQFEEEAEQRWGETDAYRESNRRTTKYSKQDWEIINRESQDLVNRMAELLQSGIVPKDTNVLSTIEEYRQHFNRWYYACSKIMHAELGKMYVADQRFKDNYEKVQPGLAQYICDATIENLRRDQL